MSVIRVLIAGACGFLGRALTEVLEEKSSDFEISAFDSLILNVTNLAHAQKVVEIYKPDVIVNCAGVTGNTACKEKPKRAWGVNVLGTANLVKLCQDLKIFLVQPSSVAVFDGKEGNYKRFDEPRPEKKNLYAETKYTAERIVQTSGIRYLIVRLPRMYGPAKIDRNTNMLARTIRQLQNGGHFSAQYTMNPLMVDDAARFIAALVKRSRDFRDVFHIGGPDELTEYDFAELVNAQLGCSRGPLITRIGDSLNMTLNTEACDAMGESMGVSKFLGTNQGILECLA